MTSGGKGNRGIQVTGGSVSADVLAVGDGATANKTINIASASREEMRSAVEELAAALASRFEDPTQRAVLDTDIARLREETQREQVDPGAVESVLETIAGKLQMVGVTLKGAVDLIAPIKKLGTAIGIGLAFLA